MRVRRGGGRIIRGATKEGDGERERERNRLLTPGSRGRQTREEYRRPQEKEGEEREKRKYPLVTGLSRYRTFCGIRMIGDLTRICFHRSSYRSFLTKVMPRETCLAQKYLASKNIQSKNIPSLSRHRITDPIAPARFFGRLVSSATGKVRSEKSILTRLSGVLASFLT